MRRVGHEILQGAGDSRAMRMVRPRCGAPGRPARGFAPLRGLPVARSVRAKRSRRGQTLPCGLLIPACRRRFAALAGAFSPRGSVQRRGPGMWRAGSGSGAFRAAGPPPCSQASVHFRSKPRITEPVAGHNPASACTQPASGASTERHVLRGPRAPPRGGRRGRTDRGVPHRVGFGAREASAPSPSTNPVTMRNCPAV